MIQIDSTKIPPLRRNDRVLGRPSTTLILMEYGNYQCPSSGQMYVIVKKLQQELGEHFCFVFRHFPQLEVYPQSLKTSEAAEAAGRQGKFWKCTQYYLRTRNS